MEILIFDFYFIPQLEENFYFVGKENELYASGFNKEKVLSLFSTENFILKFDKKEKFLFREEIKAYFERKLQVFATKPVFWKKIKGYTEKTEVILKETQKVFYGETISYSELGERFFNNKRLARVVGRAMGLNYHPILIPCHRVIKKNGQIGNFSDGKDKKRFLLNLEKW